MNNSNVRSISVLALIAVNIIFTLSVFLNCKKEINHLKQEKKESYDKALVIARLNSILISDQVRITKGKEAAFNVLTNFNRRFDNIGSDYKAYLDSIILYN